MRSVSYVQRFFYAYQETEKVKKEHMEESLRSVFIIRTSYFNMILNNVLKLAFILTYDILRTYLKWV